MISSAVGIVVVASLAYGVPVSEVDTEDLENPLADG